MKLLKTVSVRAHQTRRANPDCIKAGIQSRRTSDRICALALDPLFISTAIVGILDGSGDLVLRLYEAKRAETRCNLAFHLPVVRLWECNMLEEPLIECKRQICTRLHAF